MPKKCKKPKSDCLRIDPEARLCPKFDSTGTALFPAPDREKMGVCVMDDCAEEHIM